MAFSPPGRRGQTSKKAWFVAGAIVFVIIAASVAIPLLRARAQRPFVSGLEPPIGEPGAPIRVIGHNFGDDRGESKVEFDGAPPTASSYIEWSDTAISLRVPLYAESSLVRVVTEAGRSNPKIFMSRDLLPSAPSGPGAQALGPSIVKLSSDSGAVGSLLVIEGLNFGSNRDDSTVLFTWMGESAIIGRGDESGRGFVSPQESSLEFESWSDKRIAARIPDGAVSGGVAVKTARGTSPVRYFQILDSPGTKTYIGRRTYALSTFVTISRVRSSGSNGLYLWMPFPLETASQRGVKALNRSVEPLIPDFKGLSAYRLVDLADDKLVTVTQDHLVQVYAVETDIKADKVKSPPSPEPPLYAELTAPDPLVPSADKDIAAMAKRVAGKEKNPYRLAKALFDALLFELAFDPSAISDSPAQALKAKRADAWDMAIIYAALLRASGVPAQPMAGVVVDDARRAWRHAWVEFYLYGFGWVPVDPALADGASIGDFRPPFDDRSRYFGNMDDRHIAFSRGLAKLSPITPGGRTVSASRRYSFQSVFEEAAGGLTSYTSFWSDVEVTGVY